MTEITSGISTYHFFIHCFQITVQSTKKKKISTLSLCHVALPPASPLLPSSYSNSHIIQPQILKQKAQYRLSYSTDYILLKEDALAVKSRKPPIIINMWWIQSQIWSFLVTKPTTFLLSFPYKLCLKSFWPTIHFNLHVQHLQCTTVLKSKIPHCEWKKYLGMFRRYSQTHLGSHCHSNVFYATQRSLQYRDHLVLLDASYCTLRHYRVYHHSKQIGFH